MVCQSLGALGSQNKFEDVSSYNYRPTCFWTTQKNAQPMDSHAQNNGQVFVTPTPYVNQGELNATSAATYRPTYIMVAQQEKVPASGKCKSIFAGRISTIWLGSVLLVCGAMSQAGAAVAFRYFAGLSEVGVGIWCGNMFIAAGAVAIAAGHHGTRKLIIGTIVAAALTIVASIAQLTIAGIGLSNDDDYYSCYPHCDYQNPSYYCPCYYDHWGATAIAANGVIVGAAAFAFIAGLWILAVACIAFRRNPASFQGASVPAQAIGNTAQPNQYENIPHQRGYTVPVQHVQQPQQQLISLSQLPSNAVYQPALSQGQQVMQMPTSYIPLQTNPNQQVFQVPVQLILNTSQSNVPEEMRNQQMHSIPVQYVLQQQKQQQMPLIHPQPNTTNPSTIPPQGQDNQAFPKIDDDDVGKAFEF